MTRKRGQSKLKPCGLPGCPEMILKSRLFCWDHWSALPMTMQDEILSTMRGKGLTSVILKLLPGAVSYLQRKQQPKEATDA